MSHARSWSGTPPGMRSPTPSLRFSGLECVAANCSRLVLNKTEQAERVLRRMRNPFSLFPISGRGACSLQGMMCEGHESPRRKADTTMTPPVYSTTFKVQVVQESFQPGVTVEQVAARFGISSDQLLQWRQAFQEYVPTLRGGVLRRMRKLDQMIID